MYELIKVGERTYYIDSPVKTGLYVMKTNEVVLLDSGNDKDAAKKIAKHIRENGWQLKLIINTHSHADHIGGNAYLYEQFGCEIVTSGIESAVTQYPVLEPAYLFGGFPPKPLRNKFLMAKPSDCKTIETYGEIEGIEWFPLEGHGLDMIGVRTGDGVCFLGDAFNGVNILEKYHVSFLYDVKGFLETLDKLEIMEATCFVPAHSEVTTDIKAVIQANRQKTHEIIELIKMICGKPIQFEALLKMVFDHYHLKMDMNQYVLVGSTIKSYLAYLYDSEQLTAIFEDNEMKWGSAQ